MDVMRVEGAELPGEYGTRGRERASERTYKAHGKRLEFLKANAGNWCRLVEGPAGDRKARYRADQLATRVRFHRAFADCEFAVRTVGGKCVLFGRYVPPANAEAA
jgi:hypothetical protein